MKLRQVMVYMVFADAKGGMVHTRTGGTKRMLETEAVRILNRKGWKVRGRPVMLAEQVLTFARHK